MKKQQIENNFSNIQQQVEKINKLSFKKKKEYILSLKKWLFDIVDRNYRIKSNHKLEKANRIRQNVYCLDFGVNVGSEFNFFHFCVVIKEFDYTAIVVPLSTEKENDAEWKSAGNLIIPIGSIEDMPRNKKPVYAMVNQIKTVSKQRLTDYYDNETGKHTQMTLEPEQMQLIFDVIESLSKQKIKSKKKSIEHVDAAT